MITVTRRIDVPKRAGSPRVESPSTEIEPVGRIPRISKLMALAIRFDGLIRDGTVADQSELAELARVTQPRVTQIMNLLHLAPDIQEKLLFLPPITEGRDVIHERMLRDVCAERSWQRQRKLYSCMLKTTKKSISPGSIIDWPPNDDLRLKA